MKRGFDVHRLYIAFLYTTYSEFLYVHIWEKLELSNCFKFMLHARYVDTIVKQNNHNSYAIYIYIYVLYIAFNFKS